MTTASSAELYLPNTAVPVLPIDGQPIIEVCSEFTIADQAEVIGQSRETLWLEPELFADLGIQDNTLSAVWFNEVPEWKEGREDSLQQVFFGNLTLATDNDEVTTIPVACKPYHSWAAGAIHEYAAFQYVNSTGFIETFHPVGIWKDIKGNNFLISHFEEEVKSLDNVDWFRNADDPLREHINIFSALEMSAFILGRLHSQGLVHRDAQVKNMAADSRGIRAVDLTRLMRFATPEEPNAVAMREEMLSDVVEFMRSVMRFGFLRGDEVAVQQQVLRSVLITPYKSTLLHPSSGIEANCGPGTIQKAIGVCNQLETLVGRDDIVTGWDDPNR